MDRLCKSCRAVVPEESLYCPNCSLPLFHPHGPGLIRLLRTVKSMVSEAPESGTRAAPKSRLEWTEDQCRDTLRKVTDVQNKMDICMSHMKGLPTVLVANGIALVITAEFDERLNLIAGLVFVGFLSLLITSVLWYLRLRNELPRLRRTLSDQESESANSRRIAQEMFRVYKNQYMPNMNQEVVSNGIFGVNGKVHPSIRNRAWRNSDNITAQRQQDMEFLDSHLCRKMGELNNTSVAFYDAFDMLYETCESRLMPWIETMKPRGSGTPTDRSYLNSCVVSIYRVYSRPITRADDLEQARREGLIDDLGMVFLSQHFFSPSDVHKCPVHEKAEDGMTIAKLVESAEQLRKRAEMKQRDVLADLRYGYSGET